MIAGSVQVRPAVEHLFCSNIPDPMKHLFAFLCVLFLLPATFAQQAPLDPWTEQLVGRWEGPLGAGTYAEEWHKVQDGTYEGTARMTQGGKVVSTERMRLTWFAGSWLFIASTEHGITCFVRASDRADTWIFQNREHDFPQRIGYTIKGDVLSAWIDDGKDNGQRMDFHLARLK